MARRRRQRAGGLALRPDCLRLLAAHLEPTHRLLQGRVLLPLLWTARGRPPQAAPADRRLGGAVSRGLCQAAPLRVGVGCVGRRARLCRPAAAATNDEPPRAPPQEIRVRRAVERGHVGVDCDHWHARPRAGRRRAAAQDLHQGADGGAQGHDSRPGEEHGLPAARRGEGPGRRGQRGRRRRRRGRGRRGRGGASEASEGQEVEARIQVFDTQGMWAVPTRSSVRLPHPAFKPYRASYTKPLQRAWRGTSSATLTVLQPALTLH
mmetsp:Transcript_15853/g.36047  ORF Transcript_15853/g.36047 Transcript_15853/m.36047 type:complete len:264 (-) Transcript_15853:142-933(-)